MKKLTVLAILAAVAIYSSPVRAACDEAVGKAAAAEVQKSVNLLVDTHKSICSIAESNGRCSILCISEQRVTNFDPWIVWAGAAGGKAARERGLSKFSDVSIADRGLLGDHRAYIKIDIEQASKVQEDAAANLIDAPTALRRMKAASKLVPLPPKTP